MNTKTAQQIAIAFKRGLAFIRGIKNMAQDADPDEKWITIGAAKDEDGERHGGRPVCISKSTGKILKGLSKDVQGKTLKDAFKELKSDTYEVTPGSGVMWKKPKGANKAQTAEIKKAKDAYISLSEGTAADLEPYVAELKKLRKVVKGTPDAAILENRIKELTRNVLDLSLNAGEDLAKKYNELVDIKSRGGGRDFSQDYETQKKVMDMISKELKDYTDGRIKFAKDVVDWVKSKKAGNKILGKDAIPEELIRYSTRWVTIGRGARIMVDSNGTIRAGLGGKYNGRQFADVFKSREITGEKDALEKPEEQIEEMTEEQHAGEVNGAGVLDKLINGVSVWP